MIIVGGYVNVLPRTVHSWLLYFNKQMKKKRKTKEIRTTLMHVLKKHSKNDRHERGTRERESFFLE